MLAFLYLTYDNPNKTVNYLIKNGFNIYIHPKNIVDDKYKKYVIKNIIQTQWAKFSIVEATINLLKEAIKNEDNKYFILCSQDSFLLQNKNMLNKYNEKLSSFNYINSYQNLYKTSQWWILNRIDAEIICTTENKYKNIFKNIKLQGAPDENYFLSVLQRENKLYKYNNVINIYIRWIKANIILHPITFNKLTNYDIIDIKRQNCMFIRKTLPTFTIKKIKLQEELYIIYIGTETDFTKLEKYYNKDYILLNIISIDKINKNILDNCILCLNTHYNLYQEHLSSFIKNETKYLNQWKYIYNIDDKYNVIKNI